jgi:hypothetical protein
METLEQRTALTTVAPPTIALAAASDTGVRGDGITRLARPTFAGTAPARSYVVVYADDSQLLGVTRANAFGRWGLVTSPAAPIATGAHTIKAYAVNAGNVWSSAGSIGISVDSTPPTATIAYDPNFQSSPASPVTGRATVTFSEPVRGVSLANVRFTDPATGFSVAFGSPLLRSYVGVITVTQLSDRSYAFTPSIQTIGAGSYNLTFLKTGVYDFAGNPLAANASTTFVAT